MQIWVQEVSKIIEITSEFQLDIYVTEKWIDPSLAYGHLNPCKKYAKNLGILLKTRKIPDFILI